MLTPLFLALVLGGYEIVVDRAHNAVDITTGSHYTTLGEAIQAAADIGWRTVRLPRGTHAIGTPFEVEADNFALIGYSDTRITNMASGAIGFGTITGDQCLIDGGTWDTSNWVDDQVGLTISDSRSPKVRNLTLYTTVDGVDNDSADYMTGLLMEGNWLEEVYGNRAHPRLGMTPFRTHLAASPNWHDNAVCSDVLREPTSGGDYRECTVPFHMEGMFKGNFHHNTIGGLGSAENPIPYGLLLQWDSDFAGEQGHNNIEGNEFEDSYALRWIAVYGGNWNRITNNLLGQNEAAATIFQSLNFAASSAQNQAAIHIDSDNHGIGYGVTNLIIKHNDMHNWGGNNSPVIAASRCVRLYIDNNQFGFVNKSDGVITIDGDTCLNDVYVRWNHFDGSGQARPLFVFQGTAESQITNLMYIGNTEETFTSREPVFGIWGPYDPFGSGYDTTLQISSTAIAFSSIGVSGVPTMLASAIGPYTNGLAVTATTLTRSDGGSFITEGFKVGDVFTIASAEQAGNNGNHTCTAVTATVLTASASTFNTTGTPDTLATLKPNVFQSLVAGDYIQVEGSAAKKQRGVQKVLTKTAVAIGLVTELFDTGAGNAPTNDFSVVAAGDPIVVKVFRRGYNSNLHQN